jgi:polysaccharide export outer membrane protein
MPAAAPLARFAPPLPRRHARRRRLPSLPRLPPMPNPRPCDTTRPIISRGRTTAGLAAEISSKLRAGFIREPSVAVEIEAYRPFFILGEVAAPGQYPYVPNITVESAVAIAGGFSPRARRDSVTVTHTDASGTSRFVVPPGSPVSPGDTVLVSERWF